MRRILFLGLALVGLLGSGCRSCGDRPHLFDRLAGRGREETHARPAASHEPCCPEGHAATMRRSGSPTIIGTPVAGWPNEGAFGVPVYPGGTPYPITPGGTRPANELPYPNILPPGVPEGPARPMPAVPDGAVVLPAPGARTTGDAKGK